MKKLYCVIFGKYRKFKKPKMSHIFGKILVLFTICSKCKSKDKKYLKKKNQLKYKKVLV